MDEVKAYLEWIVLLGGILLSLFKFIDKVLLNPWLDKVYKWLNRDRGFLGRNYGSLVEKQAKIINLWQPEPSNFVRNNVGFEYRIWINDKKIKIEPSKINRYTRGFNYTYNGQLEREVIASVKVSSSIHSKAILYEDNIEYFKWEEFYTLNEDKKRYTSALYSPVNSKRSKSVFIGISTELDKSKVRNYISILNFGNAFDDAEEILILFPDLKYYLLDFGIDPNDFIKSGKIKKWY